jgi:hypothetical protein
VVEFLPTMHKALDLGLITEKNKVLKKSCGDGWWCWMHITNIRSS